MTFAVQWPGPVSGHPASKIRDTEAEAEAERRRLELTGLRHVVVVEFEEEA